MPLQIGPYTLKSRLLLSPMAGITDRPYRDLCRRFGAGLTTAEMLSSDASLQHTRKSLLRMIDPEEPEPRSIQIVGTDPRQMAEAALRNVENGAQIIDINMGCPAKKVCNKAAGSALMQDIHLVKKILGAVVKSVHVPVTLKTRTGWDDKNRNVLEIARIAEQSGISCLSVHGRTRTQGYTGHAEYETIRQIKQVVSIPVIANGDIEDAATARFIYDYSGADGLMLGRVTQGRPWIFSEMLASLKPHITTGFVPFGLKLETAIAHIAAIHRFYGTDQGVRVARKHLGWYLSSLTGHDVNRINLLRKSLFSLKTAERQLEGFKQCLTEISLNDSDFQAARVQKPERRELKELK